MSKCMVRLKYNQQGTKGFSHPMLPRKLPTCTEEEIKILVPKAVNGDQEARDTLVMCHLPLLRRTISRYLYHWPLTRRFLDEMVSVGLYAITLRISKLEDESWGGDLLGLHILRHVRKHIEMEIAKLRGIAPAPARTNQRRVRNGQPPIFGEVEGDIQHPNIKDGFSYMEAGFEELDTLDAVNKLQVESNRCELLLRKEYWGLTDAEAAEKTGIPRQTVHWYRTEMLKRYRELTGDEEC